ncbi:unnamed protein product [Lymnaea stagnalis]|uniref:Caffeoyl-CoA O-methyltransferase n=1 Tax=Lymnaea stagnalis TaxID=6523 RepID=A0AAV2I4E5_LYMST
MVTIDQDDYLKDFVEEAVKSSPHHYKIKILIGKALGLLQQMVDNGEKFDVIFLDADKGEYIEYFKLAFEQNLLSSRGTVLVDNAYMLGEGYMKSFGETNSKIFARAVASNPDLHSVLVPIRDGILMIRRLSDVEGDVRKA